MRRRLASSGSPRGERARRLVDLQEHIQEKRGRVKVDRLAPAGARRQGLGEVGPERGRRRDRGQGGRAARPRRGAASGGVAPVVPARARRARNRSIRAQDQVEARLGPAARARLGQREGAGAVEAGQGGEAGRSARRRAPGRRDWRGGSPRPPSRRRVRPARRASSISPPALRSARARSSGASGARRSSRQRERMVGSRREGWWRPAAGSRPAGGSSSSFSSALAALRVHLVDAVDDRRAAAAVGGGEWKKLLHLPHLVDRDDCAKLRCACRSAVRRSRNRRGSDRARLRRATGWSAGMSSVSGGAGAKKPPSSSGVASRKRAILQASVALPTPRGPVSSQPWCRRPCR